MDVKQGNMSATYVSSKRKARPQLKPKTPAIATVLVQEFEEDGTQPSKIEESSSQITERMQRTYSRKKYHNLQTVPMSATEDSEASFGSLISSSFPSTADEPTTSGGYATTSGGYATTCGNEGRVDGGSTERRGAGDGETDDGVKRKRIGEEEALSPGGTLIQEREASVPVPVVMHTQSLCVAQMPSDSKGQAVKKDGPSYPPGSQEERWHMQILAKGRATCPKCKSVGRKTVEGLKKHMASCRLVPLTCPHCGKQLKSSTGMKYHLMADHNNLPSPEDADALEDQSVKEKLRKVLKRLGKLKCSKEGCSGSFTSIMGYLYHMRKCGKGERELEKLLMNCRHCGKPYRSRAGLEYHLKSEHGPTQMKEEEEEPKAAREPNPERTPSGRVKRASAQVAVFHLREIANQELLKEWPKRKVQSDLVPDDKKLKYARPGLPAFSQDVLRRWKSEVKLQRRVQCPNQGCDSVYTSVSGLKAHLGLCTRGAFEAGKYKCLICDKEFSSESGVKYHINSVHSQDWFVVSSKEKLLRTKSKEDGASLSDPPTPSPALRFPLGLKTWQDGQAPPASLCGADAGQGSAEGRRQEEGERGMERECRRGKNCDEFSDSSSSGSSSSDSEAEEEPRMGPEARRSHAWALQRPPAPPETSSP